jgi:hypothetical protein
MSIEDECQQAQDKDDEQRFHFSIVEWVRRKKGIKRTPSLFKGM